MPTSPNCNSEEIVTTCTGCEVIIERNCASSQHPFLKRRLGWRRALDLGVLYSGYLTKKDQISHRTPQCTKVVATACSLRE